MSPYLFVLVMEYLNRTLKSLANDPNYNYHPRCEMLGIIHLSFADDLLLFARGDLGSIKLMYDKFHLFTAATGLKQNPLKCQVYMEGLNQEGKNHP